MKETVGTAAKLPIKANELDFYMTIPSFKDFIHEQNDKLLRM